MMSCHVICCAFESLACYRDHLKRNNVAEHLWIALEMVLATLANGETKPIITGFLKTDLEVETPAGKVILPDWHIDVMQGPSKECLLYLGQREEQELKLKSYRDQLTEVARQRQEKGKRFKGTTDAGTGRKQPTATRVEIDGKLSKVVFRPGEQPRFKIQRTVGHWPTCFVALTPCAPRIPTG